MKNARLALQKLRGARQIQQTNDESGKRLRFGFREGGVARGKTIVVEVLVMGGFAQGAAGELDSAGRREEIDARRRRGCGFASRRGRRKLRKLMKCLG